MFSHKKNITLLGFLLTLTLLSVLVVIYHLPKMLSGGFYPRFSAFTFPFVITTIGLKLANKLLVNEYELEFLNIPVKFLEITTIILVIFVLYKYTQFLYKKWT